MKTRIEEVWEEIQRDAQLKPIAEGSFKLVRISQAFRFSVFGGMDASGYVMLAVGVTQTPPALKLDSAALDYFRQRRNDGTWLMALRSRQVGLAGVFGRLCQDLVDTMAIVPDEEALVALFRERLTLWKKLFAQGTVGLLESYQVKGLIAELLALESIVRESRRSPLEAVTAWVGPRGADQDFQFSDEAIEVKAVNPGADSISISSLEQLDAPVPIRVSVYVMRPASPGESGAIGLNSLVLRLEGHLAAFPDALSIFKGRLLEGRYVEDPHYDTLLFQPMSYEEFLLTDTSPRLTIANVPRGVAAASYSLSLGTLRDPR
jgi:hypothetical protein